jgi:hypothetical protein
MSKGFQRLRPGVVLDLGPVDVAAAPSRSFFVALPSGVRVFMALER